MRKIIFNFIGSFYYKSFRKTVHYSNIHHTFAHLGMSSLKLQTIRQMNMLEISSLSAYALRLLVFVSCLSPTVLAQTYQFTQDYSSNGNLCLGSQCLTSSDVELLVTRRASSTPVAFRSFSNSTSFIAAENAGSAEYQTKPLIGSKLPQMFPFAIQRRNIPSFAACYALTGTNLFLTRSQGNLTFTRCYQAAIRSGDTFFSLQNFGQCTSGSAISAASATPATNCMFACTLNSSQIVGRSTHECGDSSSAAVFEINSAQTDFVVDAISNGTQVRFQCYHVLKSHL